MKRRTLWINLSLAVVLVLVIGLVVLALGSGGQQAPARTVTATSGTVTATVTASGTVQSSGSVQLAFGSVGTVTEVAVEAGDAVTAGQVLATVDSVAALQQLASAQSNLASALSSSNSADSSVAAAQRTLANTKKTAEETNTRNKQAVTQAKSNLRATEATFSDSCLNTSDTTCPNPAAQAALRAAETSAATAQSNLDAAIASAQSNLINYNVKVNQTQATANKAQADRDASCDPTSTATCRSAESTLLAAQQALENAINARTAGQLADQQAIVSATNALASANVAVQKSQADLRKAYNDAVRAAKQALTNAEQAFELGVISGQQSINSAQASLASAQSATAPVQIADGQELSPSAASIQAAETQVKAAEQAIAETQIVAPFAGTIGSISYVVGESSAGAASATSTPGITLLPSGGLEVFANFAEADAAKVNVGDMASVSFAALGDVAVAGTVVAIDPVSTTGTNALVTYGIRVSLNDAPPAVREGMTASVTITVDEVSGVVLLPQSVISQERGETYVEVPGAEGETTRVPVTLGLKGDLGVEILSGINEGDVVVVPESDEATTSGNFPQGGMPGSGGRG